MVVPDQRRLAVARVARTALFIALSVTLLCGCARRGPVYADTGTPHTKATALVVLSNADTAAIASRPTTDGIKLRHDALAALRRQGAKASEVADLLTRTFPSDTSGVPVYVERATFGGKPAVLVVEATGPGSGSLNSKRVWVVGDNGDILFAGSR
jgi:hypothetical protein